MTSWYLIKLRLVKPQEGIVKIRLIPSHPAPILADTGTKYQEEITAYVDKEKQENRRLQESSKDRYVQKMFK